jgi:hypothetical protein
MLGAARSVVLDDRFNDLRVEWASDDADVRQPLLEISIGAGGITLENFVVTAYATEGGCRNDMKSLKLVRSEPRASAIE